MTQGNYSQDVLNGGCPHVFGDVFCLDVANHEQPPPIWRGNLHWAKVFSPLDGSSTIEWA